jgi:hypothetical protein
MKIQLRLTKEDQSNPLTKNSSYIKALLDREIEFVQDKEDFFLIHASALDNNMLQTGRPIAILERTDSTNIIKKQELSYSNVIGVIKNTILRPSSLNNEPHYYGRYHNKLMWDLIPEKNNSPYNIPLTEVNPKLTELELKKVMCGYSFCHYDKMDIISNISINFKRDREIDLHFAGTTDYGSNIVTSYHRTIALQEAKKLNQFSAILASGRPIPQKQYFLDLLNSKIVLSPWGHGEACYRDFEALFCGCILLKPDSNFVECWPDIYVNNETYIPCKPDFSDLKEKIEWIKSNWNKLSDFRERNMLLVKEARRPDNFAEHMSEVFNNCFKRIQ